MLIYNQGKESMQHNSEVLGSSSGESSTLCSCCMSSIGVLKLTIQGPSSKQPSRNDQCQYTPKVRSRCSQRTQTKDEALLNERTPRFPQGVADDIHGCFPFGARLIVQGNVRHLFARIKQRILGRLGHNVLECPHQHRQHEWRGAEKRGHGGPHIGCQDQTEKHCPSHTEGDRGDGGRNPPAKSLKNLASQKHHHQSDGPSGTGEVPHESAVRVGVRELGLQPGLPSDLHNVDAHAIAYDQQCQITDVRTIEQELSTFLHG
mmetsp:Transcript_4921/g.7803  ORF Transcript_4921/g.7803 Transcript_4921/m.7803 type:complete len:261 (-) Transcript_4921:1323-2105(-)